MQKANLQTDQINGQVKKQLENVVALTIANYSTSQACKFRLNGFVREIPAMTSSVPNGKFVIDCVGLAFDVDIDFIESQNVVLDYFTVIPTTPNLCE